MRAARRLASEAGDCRRKSLELSEDAGEVVGERLHDHVIGATGA
jgi:hypothetical protein